MVSMNPVDNKRPKKERPEGCSLRSPRLREKSAWELRRNRRDVPALELREIQFVGVRLTVTVSAGDLVQASLAGCRARQLGVTLLTDLTEPLLQCAMSVYDADIAATQQLSTACYT